MRGRKIQNKYCNFYIVYREGSAHQVGLVIGVHNYCWRAAITFAAYTCMLDASVKLTWRCNWFLSGTTWTVRVCLCLQVIILLDTLLLMF